MEPPGKPPKRDGPCDRRARNKVMLLWGGLERKGEEEGEGRERSGEGRKRERRQKRQSGEAVRTQERNIEASSQGWGVARRQRQEVPSPGLRSAESCSTVGPIARHLDWDVLGRKVKDPGTTCQAPTAGSVVDKNGYLCPSMAWGTWDLFREGRTIFISGSWVSKGTHKCWWPCRYDRVHVLLG